MVRPIQKLLVANRSEIAIRVMRTASEMKMRTVAIYSQQDRQALHRFKADESYLVGKGKSPVAAYLAGDEILAIAKRAKVDAIHAGTNDLFPPTVIVWPSTPAMLRFASDLSIFC